MSKLLTGLHVYMGKCNFICRMLHPQNVESMICLAKLLDLICSTKVWAGFACVCVLVFREVA